MQAKCPKHVAIIMDGNGRWAKRRHLPRAAGHKAGVDTVRKIVQHAANLGIDVLTLFTFSSENWQRPEEEVNHLMTLFSAGLNHDVKKLHKNNIKVRVIGDRTGFNDKLQKSIMAAERLTENNTGLQVLIAANYGGHWDITQAAQRLAQQVQQGQLAPQAITSAHLAGHLSTADVPEPDLFIRTGGEQRISNFLLWQLSYSELYFTDIMWPEFDAQCFDEALAWFATKTRRFGHIDEQLGEHCA